LLCNFLTITILALNTTMELTFLNDLGQSFVVEIDSNMELENVMALLEAEVGGEGLFERSG
jgi:hypothetical protein